MFPIGSSELDLLSVLVGRRADPHCVDIRIGDYLIRGRRELGNVELLGSILCL
jgi:hypothetical protein